MPSLDLARKIGPLPLGGWLAAGAGGVGLAVVVRRRAAAATAVSMESVADDSSSVTVDRAPWAPAMPASPPPEPRGLSLSQTAATCKAELERLRALIASLRTERAAINTQLLGLRARLAATVSVFARELLKKQIAALLAERAVLDKKIGSALAQQTATRAVCAIFGRQSA